MTQRKFKLNLLVELFTIESGVKSFYSQDFNKLEKYLVDVFNIPFGLKEYNFKDYITYGAKFEDIKKTHLLVQSYVKFLRVNGYFINYYSEIYSGILLENHKNEPIYYFTLDGHWSEIDLLISHIKLMYDGKISYKDAAENEDGFFLEEKDGYLTIFGINLNKKEVIAIIDSADFINQIDKIELQLEDLDFVKSIFE